MRTTLILLALLVGCQNADDGGTTETDLDSGEDGIDTSSAAFKNGEQIHADTCKNGYCHGGNDTLDRRVPEMTDAEITTQVTEGGGYMPAQEDLSAVDVDDVVVYLRWKYGAPE